MPSAVVACCFLLPAASPDTAVVCPAGFRGALEPWVEHRTGQGHVLVFLPSEGSAVDIRDRVRRVAEGGRLRFLLLVGDAEPGMAFDPRLRERCLPVHRAEARVNVLWGSEPHIATDNWYADLDDDRLADVAVGRLTADTPEDLAVMVQKVLAYERGTGFGPWQRKLNVVAGVGGFGVLADMALETAARYLLTTGIPPEYDVSMTHGSWSSPYCPDPRLFGQTTLDRLNEGCLFWVYIGHGQPWELDRVRTPEGEHRILGCADLRSGLACRRGLPVALFLACYAGAFDAREDCLAEEMLRHRRGPVAVIAASRVAMPYAMAVLARAMMQEFFQRRPVTLGEAVLRAKRRLVDPPEEDAWGRTVLDGVAALVSPDRGKLAEERAEHVELFNLLGDPLLRPRYPRRLRVHVEGSPEPGGELWVSGASPIEGRATTELVVRRDRLTFAPPVRSTYPRTAAERAAQQEVYRRANDRRLARSIQTVPAGPFRSRLIIPEEAEGPCHVCVMIEGPAGCAIGAADVSVHAAGAPAADAGPRTARPATGPGPSGDRRPARPARKTAVPAAPGPRPAAAR